MKGLTVSALALEEIRKLQAKREKPARGLRIGVRGGGCSGFGYLFEWSDEEPQPTDQVFTFDEGKIRIYCDPKSMVYLDGTELDFAQTLMHRGFKFVNPNVKETCGCGESVRF